jgi:hypothetical protein
MDRRTFIAAGAAFPVAGRAPAMPSADPLVSMFERWFSLRKEWDALSYLTDDWDRPDMIANEEERWAIEKQMMETKAQSIEGIAALARFQWEEFGCDTILPTQDDRRNYEYRTHRIILLSAEALSGLSPHKPLHVHRGAPMPEDF